MPTVSRSRSRDRSPRGRSRSSRRHSLSPSPPPPPAAAPALFVPEGHERFVRQLVRRCGGYRGIHKKVVQQNNAGEYLVIPYKARELRGKRRNELLNAQRWADTGRTVGGMHPLLIELATARRGKMEAVLVSFVTAIRITIDPTDSDYEEDEE